MREVIGEQDAPAWERPRGVRTNIKEFEAKLRLMKTKLKLRLEATAKGEAAAAAAATTADVDPGCEVAGACTGASSTDVGSGATHARTRDENAFTLPIPHPATVPQMPRLVVLCDRLGLDEFEQAVIVMLIGNTVSPLMKEVRFCFFDRNLHSRMPLDSTHVRLKRTCV
jgi:hypothetical protein